MTRMRMSRSRLAGVAGVVAGVLAGGATMVLAGTAVAHRLAAEPLEPLLEATHVPPLLTAPGERVELRYDVYCTAAGEAFTDAPCEAKGAVFVRPGDVGPFTELALREDRNAREGRYVAVVPAALARSPTGFAYYAVIGSAVSEKTVTLPGGGAAAPQRSRPLTHVVTAQLPAHVFGRTRKADVRIAEAAWGTGSGRVGLEDRGENLPPIGGSSFDVRADGSIHVLDEANRRLLRWSPGTGTPTHVPLAIDGTLADLAVAEDGTIHVLENAHSGRSTALLRTFGPDGAARGTTVLAERASQVRIGPAGPVVLQNASGQWMSAVERGQALGVPGQQASGRSGRPLPGGHEVVVLRTANEIRVAALGPGAARQSWRVLGETALAEVQLAEPVGNRLVLVVRTYADQQDEFVVLVLGPRGIEQRFSLDSAAWAETAPLSRFRLVGSSLYRLGSTSAGLFVDRIDLEVK